MHKRIHENKIKLAWLYSISTFILHHHSSTSSFSSKEIKIVFSKNRCFLTETSFRECSLLTIRQLFVKTLEFIYFLISKLIHKHFS